MKIEIFPDKIGDSFLISYGQNYEKHILIDGGYPDTYMSYIKKKLLELKNLGQHLELVIVTHIDQDHIMGILSLIEENGISDTPNIIRIKEIWHNSYRHLQNTEKTLENGTPEEEILEDIIKSETASLREKEGKISAYDGSMLSSYLYERKYNWNTTFDGKAVHKNDFNKIEKDDDLNIIILSPSLKNLEVLKKEWEGQLKRRKMNFNFANGKKFDDAFEFFMLRKESDIPDGHLCSYKEKINWSSIPFPSEDQSKVNMSSIAVIFETKKTKALFLGDSNPSQILEALMFLKEKKGYSLDFDIIKVSHHGSIKSTSKELIELINGKKWLFTGTGIKNKPSEGLVKYILEKKKDCFKELFFLDCIEWLEDLKKFEKEYCFKIITPDIEKNLVVLREK